jgi:large-conductance mechanosensitive channel
LLIYAGIPPVFPTGGGSGGVCGLGSFALVVVDFFFVASFFFFVTSSIEGFRRRDVESKSA